MSAHAVSSTARRADYRNAVLQVLSGSQRHGLVADALLQEAGIEPRLLESRTSAIDAGQFINLLRAITQRLGDEFFGLSERRIKQGTSAMLIDLMLACSTVGAAIEQAVNFFRIVTDDMEVRCVQSQDEFEVSVSLAKPALDPQGFLADYWLVYLHRLLSWSAAQLIPVKQVNSRAPYQAADHRLLFFIRNDWRPNQVEDSLVFSRKYWSLPIVRTRNEWQSHHQRLVQEGILGWPNGDTGHVNKVKALLLDALHQRHPLPRLQDIAATLCMSVQTLHRHLQHEGSGYQRILDDLRRDYATELLLKQHLSVAEAAEYLGFTETRSFSRAFKQWTGQTPSSLLRL
jgi:AraC-like DNA-binding protein